MRPADPNPSGAGWPWKSRVVAMTVVVVSTVATAGCGQSVDKGGFSSADRAAAETALGALEQTNVPTTLVVLTNTAGTVPTVCRVHMESKQPRRFGLFILWRPSKRVFRGTYTWFRASLTPDVKSDRFRSGYVPVEGGEAGVVKSNAGDILSRPSESCEILMNGDVRLLSR